MNRAGYRQGTEPDRNISAAGTDIPAGHADTVSSDREVFWRIRPMELSDARKAALIDREIFSEPWSEAGFRSSLESPYTRYLAVETSGELAAYCGYLRSFEDADITNVAVIPSMRQRGIARAMLAELMRLGRQDGIERFTLEVRESNTPAIHLYESLGFHTEGVRKNFYRLPTENALIMWTDAEAESI